MGMEDVCGACGLPIGHRIWRGADTNPEFCSEACLRAARPGSIPASSTIVDFDPFDDVELKAGVMPLVGEIVGYMLNTGPRSGEMRPAIVIRPAWETGNGEQVARLMVLSDGADDGVVFKDGPTLITAKRGKPCQLGCWYRRRFSE